MPKRKKTRKQKTMADVRRQTDQNVTYTTATIEPKTQLPQEHVAVTQPLHQPVRQTTQRNIITADYHYLGRDLTKTLVLTGIIIIIQLALKFGIGM